MPTCYVWPLNRAYLYSYSDTMADVLSMVARDLRVNEDQIAFFKDGEITLVPQDGMNAVVRVIKCEKHPKLSL